MPTTLREIHHIMPLIDIPTLGTTLLLSALVAAGYTFGVALASRTQPRLLRSAQYGTLATVALIFAAVFVLAYAFQTHDFRLRYVAATSDRSMSALYLFTALWGGQDGSLLWWTCLMGGYTVAFTFWIRDKYQALQPVAFATLMSVFGFFLVLMIFAANPFATVVGEAAADGEGLNPLLQNYWMAIHPPSLYLGLSGWVIPFAILVSALVMGRLGNEWLRAARRWVLVAWGFLSLGNLLGMFWSYEELGWGGYWAWDPVENASFMPWLTATAFLHSSMIQERRGMMRVWNVFLLALTFYMTIFGTFLTRSGLIASVHAFAESDLGEYFVVYLQLLGVFLGGLIAYRLVDLRWGWRIGWTESIVAVTVGVLLSVALRVAGVTYDDVQLHGYVLGLAPALILFCKLIEVLRLRVLTRLSSAEGQHKAVESLLSREFAFLLNNWILLGMMVFILVATTFPMLSEAVRGETVTVGPSFYNKWMVPFGMILLFLMGVGPLVAWRKATGKNLIKALRIPLIAGGAITVVHYLAGDAIGFPGLAEWDSIYETATGEVLASIYRVAPMCLTGLCAFVLATILQEFGRGTAARMRTKGEGAFTALVQLVSRARRRYGGYVVHAGIVLLYFGFLGNSYTHEEEASLRPGDTMTVRDFTFQYEGVRIEEDADKTMVFGDMTISRRGDTLGTVSPARFVYRRRPEMPTTEVAMHTSLVQDLYVIMSRSDPRTQEATFRVKIYPLVVWVWIGGAVLLLGLLIAVAPTLRELLGNRSTSVRRRSAGASAVVTTAVCLGLMTGFAWGGTNVGYAQESGSSSLHAGTVEMRSAEERQLFSRMLCQCGDCERLPLSTCGCGWAEDARAEIRGRIDNGASFAEVLSSYRERFGAVAIAIPADEGLDRALWVLPIALVLFAAMGLFVWVRRSRSGQGEVRAENALADTEPPVSGDVYDERLDAELESLED